MKYIFSLALVFFISSCFLFLNNEKLIQKKFLANGIIIELYYSGGGATDSDIIWIKKITKEGKEIWIGKIKNFTDSDKITITEVDSNHIALNFVVNYFPQHPVVFLIDLDNKIQRSGESSFNKPE